VIAGADCGFASFRCDVRGASQRRLGQAEGPRRRGAPAERAAVGLNGYWEQIVSSLGSLAGPVATVIAAVAAVYVTWRLGQSQLQIARQQADTAKLQADLAEVRLQHDLFDRRFAVYEAARNLVLEVVRASNVSDDGLRAFVLGTDKSVFLLDKELTEYLDDMRKRAVTLQITVGRLADPMFHPSEESTRASAQRADLSNWFFDQFDVLIEKFRPTLALDKRQMKLARGAQDDAKI
jgi:hypothetical protein